MKLLIQILFFFLTWFTKLSATPVLTKVALPSYDFSFSKIEKAKEESVIKIGVQNFARSGIEGKRFSDFSKENIWVGVACSKEEDKVVSSNMSNMLVPPFKNQIVTFSIKNVIFLEVLHLNRIHLNSLNQTKWPNLHAHVPNMLVKI